MLFLLGFSHVTILAKAGFEPNSVRGGGSRFKATTAGVPEGGRVVPPTPAQSRPAAGGSPATETRTIY